MVDAESVYLEGSGFKKAGFHWISYGEGSPWTIIELCQGPWAKVGDKEWLVRRLGGKSRLLSEAVDWKWGCQIRERGETDEALMEALDDALKEKADLEDKLKDLTGAYDRICERNVVNFSSNPEQEGELAEHEKDLAWEEVAKIKAKEDEGRSYPPGSIWTVVE